MPAKSKKQQKFFGMIHAIHKGELSPKSVSPKMREASKSISERAAKDFAKTKTSKLPTRKHKKQAAIGIAQAFVDAMTKQSGSIAAFQKGIYDTFNRHGIDPRPFMKLSANPGMHNTNKELIKQALSGGEWAQSVMLAPEYSTVVRGKLTDGWNQQLDFSDDNKKRYVKQALKKFAQAKDEEKDKGKTIMPKNTSVGKKLGMGAALLGSTIGGYMLGSAAGRALGSYIRKVRNG